MMGIKANMASFDSRWADYSNKMREEQADVETMVSIVTLESISSQVLLLIMFKFAKEKTADHSVVLVACCALF